VSIYMIWGVAVSLVGILVALLIPRHRRVALLSGLFAAPLGLLDIVFAPEYSAPHLFGHAFSLEGMLFSFGNGVLVWPVAVVPFWRRIDYDILWRNMIFRCLTCWVIAAVIIAIVWRGGVGLPGLSIMTSALVALGGCGLYILWRRPDTWPLVVTGIIGCGLIYLLEMAVLSRFYPNFVTVWAPAVRDGILVLGYPLEEYVWAMVYGGVWAPAVAFGCEARILVDGSE